MVDDYLEYLHTRREEAAAAYQQAAAAYQQAVTSGASQEQIDAACAARAASWDVCYLVEVDLDEHELALRS